MIVQRKTLGSGIKIPLSSYIRHEFSGPTIQAIKIKPMKI